MRIVATLFGLVLLLPGACGALFTALFIGDPLNREMLVISVPSLGVGLFGIWLIHFVWSSR